MPFPPHCASLGGYQAATPSALYARASPLSCGEGQGVRWHSNYPLYPKTIEVQISDLHTKNEDRGSSFFLPGETFPTECDFEKSDLDKLFISHFFN
jgi:hypothetical protein